MGALDARPVRTEVEPSSRGIDAMQGSGRSCVMSATLGQPNMSISRVRLYTDRIFGAGPEASRDHRRHDVVSPVSVRTAGFSGSSDRLWLPLCLTTLLLGCSGQIMAASDGSPAHGDGGALVVESEASSRDAAQSLAAANDFASGDASTDAPQTSCTELSTCCALSLVPAPCEATARSTDSSLCSLALWAYESSEEGPDGGQLPVCTDAGGRCVDLCGRPAPPYGQPPEPTNVSACVELLQCCSSIEDPGSSGACTLVGTQGSRATCLAATQHFQALGLCQQAGSDGGTSG